MKAWSPSSLRSLGVALTVISLALTAWQASAFAPEIRNDVFDMGLFWVQHGIALVYFILIVIHNASTKGFRKLFHFDPFMYSLALIIYSLGAHSLNYFTEIQVFAPYVTWMKGYLLLMHLAILAFPFRKKLPESFQYLLYFICGAGVLMGAYMTVFIAPLMPFAAALVWFYGFSVYALVPLFYLIYFIRSYFKMELLPHTRRAFWAGILVPVAVFFVFALRWQGVQRTIKEVRQDYQANYTQQYPEWVTLAQRLPTDPLTERVVKGDAFTQRSFWDDFGGSTLSRNIIRKQDPLATLAGLVYGHFEFYDDDLLRLLESRYRLRHETHRRLWRGDQLVTTRVESNIELYPEYRLGYTEMTLEVKNTHSWDENQQEAVYSFHLPDGAAVTSLSLWIEGKEEFSRLSTRSKADAAYVQIVGRERRDPALVHWQEGNRITVTVFPCTPQEDRRFKLGFSYPLVYENEELVLSQIYFEGPPAARAHETVTIHLNGEDSNIAQLPNRFHQKDPHTFTYSGYYRPQWKLSLKAPELSSASFSFLGKHYSTHTLEPITQPFDPTTIVLDINAAWKKTDFEAIWPWIKDKKVQVFIPHPVEMTAANREEMFAYLHQNHFSLLPLHQIADPANTLVVSQSTSSAPLLSDLEHTIFASEFEQYMVAQPENFRWFNLGTQQSPFVQSLNAFQLLDYAEGDLNELEEMLTTTQFTYFPHEPNRMNLYRAGMQLVRQDSLEKKVERVPVMAPDHLMRLFVYQELLGKMGRNYFHRDTLEDTWIRLAEEAYVVSPVSSLIVLESQEDYERTGIEENEDTLGNASLKNSGAVPEPEEWLMIFLVMGVLIYQLRLKGSRSVRSTH